jgi:hypothetical protein
MTLSFLQLHYDAVALQNFWVISNYNLVPTHRYFPFLPPTTPRFWWPPFYFLLLWHQHFLDSTYMSEIIQYLSFCTWIISVNILIFSFIHVITNDLLFLWLESILLCISSSFFFLSFLVILGLSKGLFFLCKCSTTWVIHLPFLL